MTSDTPGGNSPSTDRAGRDALTFWGFTSIVLDSAKSILRLSGLLALAAVFAGLVARPRYTTEVSFRPQSDATVPGQLSSLAAQFGFALPNGEGAESPDFYLNLLDTRAILVRIATQPYRAPQGSSATLDSLLGIDEEDSILRIESVIAWLREDAIRAHADRTTGIVSVRVRTAWPEVTEQIADAILREVDRFNAQTRRSRAHAEFTFVTAQADIAAGELHASEEAVKHFLSRNRRYTEAPDLVFEHDRLRRDLDMRQQLYTSLREALEQSKIATVRNTPVITVLQPPYVPPTADSRWLILKFIAGGFMGLLVGLTTALLRRVDPPTDPESREAYLRILGRLRIQPDKGARNR